MPPPTGADVGPVHQPSRVGLPEFNAHLRRLEVVEKGQHVLRAEEVFVAALQCGGLGAALGELLEHIE